MLNDVQHGFRRGRSCLSAILNVFNYLSEDKATCVDMVYLDYAKAFDKVDRGALLHKIRDTGRLGKWLANLLSDRLKGGISDDSPVISRDPQGTVLVSLLFTLLIADI